MCWCAMFLAAVMCATALAGCAQRKPTVAEVDSYMKARDLYLRGSIDEAAAAVSGIESRMRGFHQARLLEGKILFFKGEMNAAEHIFRTLANLRPGYLEAQLWLLRALQAQGETPEAQRLIDSVLELNPGDPRFLHQAGMLMLALDDIKGALEFFRRSQEYTVELSQSYIESARILYRFGLLDPALVDLAAAFALTPPDSGMRKPLMDLEMRIREAKK
jgi:Flp pilus assembly protein TadD